MSQGLTQKEYLKKYLSGSNKDEKKKKKNRTKVKGTGIKIIDDDVDVSKMRPLENDEIDLLGEKEDAPQIAGIIDERPDHVKLAEQYSKDKWKVITEDDGFNSKVTVQQISKKIPKLAENDKSDSDLSPPRYQRQSDSDLSPERQSSKVKGENTKRSKTKNERNGSSKKRRTNNSDSDISVDRKRSIKKEDSGSDMSPVRSKKRDNERKEKSKRNNSDSDLSPPRKNKYEGKKHEKRVERSSSCDPDLSPPRKRKEKKVDKRGDSSDSDLSPRNRKAGNNKQKPTKKEFNRSDSDLSPPRSKRKVEEIKKVKDGGKRERKSRWGDVEDRVVENASISSKDERLSDSTVRRNDRDNNRSRSREKNKKHNETDSRRYGDSSKNHSKYSDDRRYKNEMQRKEDKGREYDRREYDRQDRRNDRSMDSNRSEYRRENRQNRTDREEEEPKRMEKTLDGKKAGLQNARHMKEENEELRRKEDEMFGKLSEDLTGRNAKAVRRNISAKTETEEDKQKQREKEAKQKELDAKYNQWGKGLKQVEEQQAKVRDFVHEAAKPMARYRDDRDLEDSLRQKEREGDPMLEYMRKKGKEKKEQDGVPAVPIYNGPYPPNRFNIRPGHRWDGVDRSSGHEKNFFLAKNKRIALESEKYKWSTEDM